MPRAQPLGGGGQIAARRRRRRRSAAGAGARWRRPGRRPGRPPARDRWRRRRRRRASAVDCGAARGVDAGADLLGARGEADHARRRIAALGGGAGRASATAWLANASAPSETLSETSTSATAETARAGRRSVGAGQRDGDARPAPACAASPAARAGRARSRRATRRATSKSAGSGEQGSSQRGCSNASWCAAPNSALTSSTGGGSSPIRRAAAPAPARAPARRPGRRRARRADRAAPACVRRARAPARASVSDSRASPRLAATTTSPIRWKPTWAIATSGRSSRGRALAPVSSAGGASTRRVGRRSRGPGERVRDQQRKRGAHRQVGAARVEAGGGDAQAGALARDHQRHAERAGHRDVAGRERQPPRLGDVDVAEIELARERVVAAHVGDHRIAHAARARRTGCPGRAGRDRGSGPGSGGAAGATPSKMTRS